MDTLTRLRQLNLFSALSAKDLARVAEITTTRSYARGSYLCRQGEPNSTLFLLDSGGALLYQPSRGTDTPPSTHYVRPGQAIGEEALFLDGRSRISLQTTADLQALCIEKKDLDALRLKYRSIRRRLRISPLVKEQLKAPSFPWQAQDEPTLLLRKRHWFAFVRNLPIPILLWLGSTAILMIGRKAGLTLSPPEAIILTTLIPAGLVIWLYLDWQNDFYLITGRRILHEERAILFYETWDEMPLNKVQDTTVTRGFLGGLLGFGNLRVQTAGLRGAMILDYLPDPEYVQELICRQTGTPGIRVPKSEYTEIRAELLRQAGRAPELTTVATPQTPTPEESVSGSEPSPGRLSLTRLLRLTVKEGNQITWRKHWIFLLRKAFLPSLFVLLTAAFIVFGLTHSSVSYGPPLVLASFLLWSVSVAWLWWEAEDWRNDLYILTDRLIIDQEKKPLFFSEERRQAALDMIQNVSLRKQGLLSAMFNYGDVVIQTAGVSGEFTFASVSDPRQVQREIFRRVEAYQDSKRAVQKQQERAGISAWFKLHDEVGHNAQKPSDL